MKERLNLSRWALEHIPFIRYLIVVLLLGGIMSYSKLGQDEDPPFTFRAMVIRCLLYTSPSPRDRQKSRMPSSA